MSLDANDRYGCGALLHHGHWLGTSLSRDQQLFRNWQPPGCMIHEYDAKDISSCLESRSIVFVGDSTTRNIFWATTEKLYSRGAAEQKSIALKHEDQNFSRAGITVKFIWDPFLNSSGLYRALSSYRDSWNPGGKPSDEKDNPALLFIGGGLWHAKHLATTHNDDFRSSINFVMSFMASNGSRLNLSWKDFWKWPASRGLMLVAPVQVPSYEALHPSVQETLSPSRIDSLNGYLHNISATQEAPIVWSYSLLTLYAASAYNDSGVHVNENIVNRKADILLNMICNEKLMKLGSYPRDKTCCASYPRLNSVQSMFTVGSLAIFLWTCPLSISMYRRN